AWPDITLLLVAVVLGARLVLLGVTLLWAALHARGGPSRRVRRTQERGAGAGLAHPAGLVRQAGVARRWVCTVGALLALLLAGGAATVSAALIVAAPVVDAFYTPPRDVPDEPGRLLRSEPFTREVPPAARAWRIL